MGVGPFSVLFPWVLKPDQKPLFDYNPLVVQTGINGAGTSLSIFVGDTDDAGGGGWGDHSPHLAGVGGWGDWRCTSTPAPLRREILPRDKAMHSVVRAL